MKYAPHPCFVQEGHQFHQLAIGKNSYGNPKGRIIGPIPLPTAYYVLPSIGYFLVGQTVFPSMGMHTNHWRSSDYHHVYLSSISHLSYQSYYGLTAKGEQGHFQETPKPSITLAKARKGIAPMGPHLQGRGALLSSAICANLSPAPAPERKVRPRIARSRTQGRALSPPGQKSRPGHQIGLMPGPGTSPRTCRTRGRAPKRKPASSRGWGSRTRCRSGGRSRCPPCTGRG